MTCRAIVSLSAAVVLAGCGGGGDDDRAPATRVSPPSAPPRTETAGPARSQGAPRVQTVAEGLEVPWEIAFLPDRRALVTERPGRVRLLERDGRLRPAPVAEVDVEATGEGGLLGLALDPDFASNRFVYLYRTTGRGNEVVRYRLDRGGLREQRS